ncbi:MAG TPA: tripartite tricarboxylate transporter substrate binding protein [Tepidisphaeraceae bacterium]|jgi:tripartite-type tricarboxylate transporter receptor subunit TctC|nr:tripartite tricarboxylate transporter substrate binding protein [Tepidisphaeraceae bacterium]
MKLRSLQLFVFLLAFVLPPVHAQSFPNKPIRLVIGSFPGGGIDLAGRIIAQKMTENLRQQVIVDNRGGANGIIGMDLVAKSAPDGYTFYMGTAGHISVNPVLQSKLPFNVDRDFTPVTEVVSLPFLIYLHPSLPIKTLGDLIAYAKANPGTLTWSSSGDGGLPHLAGELVRLASGIDTRRIPYKGSAPAFNDLLGGRVQYCIEAVSIGLQHVKAGRLVALATTGPRRLTILPGVATLSETLAGVEIVNWYGALLPRGAPGDIVKRLHAEILKAMGNTDVRDKLAANGFDVVGTSPEQFAAFRKAEETRWARVIKQAGISPQ